MRRAISCVWKLKARGRLRGACAFISVLQILFFLFFLSGKIFADVRDFTIEKLCLENLIELERVLDEIEDIIYPPGGPPPALDSLVEKRFLEFRPSCPGGGNYEFIAAKGKWTVKCSLHGYSDNLRQIVEINKAGKRKPHDSIGKLFSAFIVVVLIALIFHGVRKVRGTLIDPGQKCLRNMRIIEDAASIAAIRACKRADVSASEDKVMSARNEGEELSDVSSKNGEKNGSEFRISVEELAGCKLLPEIIKCPAGGEYDIKVLSVEPFITLSVRCKIHGTYDELKKTMCKF